MNNFSFLLIAGIFVVVLLGFTIYQHELVHVANFKAVGLSSHFEVNGFTLLTVAESNYKNIEDAQTTRLANSFNEAVAYNIVPLAVMVCGVMIICTLYLKGEKK